MTDENDVKFDLNDPRLMDASPEEWTEGAGIADVSFAPPDDGNNVVILFLREQTKEDKPMVSVRPINPEAALVIADALKNGQPVPRGTTKVMATLAPRVGHVNKETGEIKPGGFMKDWYPATNIRYGQHTSELADLCEKVGKPLTFDMKNDEIVNHIKDLFESAGSEGIPVIAETRWLKTTTRVDKNGMPVFVDGNKQYDDVKGQKTIIRQAIKAAETEAKANGTDKDTLEIVAQRAAANAHKFIDPASGDEKEVRLEIVKLVAPIAQLNLD